MKRENELRETLCINASTYAVTAELGLEIGFFPENPIS